MNTIVLLFFAGSISASCVYDSRALIVNSYLSEKREKNGDLRCDQCLQDCTALQQVLTTMPSEEEAMIGRQVPLVPENFHHFLQTPILAPFPAHLETMIIGMGCFWGVERLLYKQSGVFSTIVGYGGGSTPNPSYEEVYTGYTGHSELVSIQYDPRVTSYQKLLKVFWENHDPTQGMQQGEDLGTQYRSIIMPVNQDQQQIAFQSRNLFQRELYKTGLGTITTKIIPATAFFNAETYHQQYLSKRPAGYCGVAGTGVLLPESFTE